MPRTTKPAPPSDWRGWNPPEYTPIPDALFDLWLPILTEGQLKVLMYIMRRTFGFKKAADAISLSQLCDGIVTTDGRRLDSGTGCTRSTVTAAVTALVEYGLISATPQTDARGDAAPTLYRLRMAGEMGSPTNRHTAPVGERPIPPPAEALPLEPVPYSPVIAGAILELARSLRDDLAGPGAVKEALRLWQRSGLDEAAFVAALQTAQRKQRRIAGVLAMLTAKITG